MGHDTERLHPIRSRKRYLIHRGTRQNTTQQRWRETTTMMLLCRTGHDRHHKDRRWWKSDTSCNQYATTGASRQNAQQFDVFWEHSIECLLLARLFGCSFSPPPHKLTRACCNLSPLPASPILPWVGNPASWLTNASVPRSLNRKQGDVTSHACIPKAPTIISSNLLHPLPPQSFPHACQPITPKGYSPRYFTTRDAPLTVTNGTNCTI